MRSAVITLEAKMSSDLPFRVYKKKKPKCFGKADAEIQYQPLQRKQNLFSSSNGDVSEEKMNFLIASEEHAIWISTQNLCSKWSDVVSGVFDKVFPKS